MRRWLLPALFAAILAVGRPPPRAEAHPLPAMARYISALVETSLPTSAFQGYVKVLLCARHVVLSADFGIGLN